MCRSKHTLQQKVTSSVWKPKTIKMTTAKHDFNQNMILKSPGRWRKRDLSERALHEAGGLNHMSDLWTFLKARLSNHCSQQMNTYLEIRGECGKCKGFFPGGSRWELRMRQLCHLSLQNRTETHSTRRSCFGFLVVFPHKAAKVKLWMQHLKEVNREIRMREMMCTCVNLHWFHHNRVKTRLGEISVHERNKHPYLRALMNKMWSVLFDIDA